MLKEEKGVIETVQVDFKSSLLKNNMNFKQSKNLQFLKIP